MNSDSSARDRDILRRLAERQAQIAALPIHAETIAQWKRLNRLEPGRPMVWVNEICWPEMGDELRLETSDPFCQAMEKELRRTLYQWDHLPGDMVVEPCFYCPMVIPPTGIGPRVSQTTIDQGASGSIQSHAYESIIRDESDLELIRPPVVTVDREAGEIKRDRMERLIGDILPIRLRGRNVWWFSPWDQLVQWWNPQQALMDLVLRPELVHLAMDRLVSARLAELDQYERLGLMALNNGNVRVGSGGLGYTDLLPQAGSRPGAYTARDLWGTATAQIFSEVSPEMHWEFALKYEMRWLERFGLNCYGCCEPLHRKMHILERIPNLRRVSMSPKVDIAQGSEALGRKYIYSHKPNPAVLAGSVWNPDAARAELRRALELTRGCVVEIILKDISTVRNEPLRLWEWTRMASAVAAEFA